MNKDHKTKFIESYRDKLRADRADVRSQRHRLAEEEDAIDELLRGVELQLSKSGDAGSTQLEMPETVDETLTPNGKRSLKGEGMRDAMREVMSTSGRGLRPRDIARKLEERDFTYSSTKVSLSSRVSNELYSLKKADKVRSSDGRYRLVPEGG